MPSSTSAPGVVTPTDPPAPVPAVVLTISAPLVTVICGALTVTEPALPLAVALASAKIPPPPLSDSGPCETQDGTHGAKAEEGPTTTNPPLPAPAVLEVT